MMFVIFLSVGCATVSQWDPPQVPLGWFSGTGRGASCEAARTRALKDLCSCMFVQVRGSTSIHDRQVITRAMGQGVKVRFSQVVDMVVHTRTHCTFEGSPYRETRKTTPDGACHIQLTMSRQAFGRYLRGRTLAVRLAPLPTGFDEGDRQRITTALYNHFAHKGYLVLYDPGAAAAHAANAGIHLDLRKGATGLYAAGITMDIRVLRTKGGRLDRAVTVQTTLRYGFDRDVALHQAVGDLVRRLDGREETSE